MFRKKDLANKTEIPIMPKKRSIERKNYFEGEKSSKVNCLKCIVCQIHFLEQCSLNVILYAI